MIIYTSECNNTKKEITLGDLGGYNHTPQYYNLYGKKVEELSNNNNNNNNTSNCTKDEENLPNHHSE